jgi:hypothetical protein
MGINILEKLYVSLTESRMITGVEIWGQDDRWREIGKVHEMFHKRIMGAPTAAANNDCVQSRTKGGATGASAPGAIGKGGANTVFSHDNMIPRSYTESLNIASYCRVQITSYN